MDGMVKTVCIGDRQIGAGEPCFIISEAGVNHNGDVGIACKLIDAAAEAGADAVKFQIFRAEKLVAMNAPKAGYQKQTTDVSESQFEMLRRLELSPEEHVQLSRYCDQAGLLFLSTPFDSESADFLQELGVKAFKIPSGEITNPLFLAHVAGKGLPMIVSTGMSTLLEVEQAVQVIESQQNQDYVLLHCVSNYPARPADVNLRAMATLERTFQCPVGYSDHTLGHEVSVAAVVLGACVIEKHFTLDGNLPGPDHRASLEPHELKQLVCSIRNVESALGTGRKVPAASEADTASVARRSLVAAMNIPAGTTLTSELIVALRPGTGIPPTLLDEVIGRRTRTEISAGTPLHLEMLV
jgi:N-acetylneuraminate synthase